MVPQNNLVCYLPIFANIQYYAQAIGCQQIIIPKQMYQKHWHINKFTITTSHGYQHLSLPLQGGRTTKNLIENVEISYQENWIKTHLRTIQTAYSKAPFFENIFPYIEDMYQSKPILLLDYIQLSHQITCKILKLSLPINSKPDMVENYKPKPLDISYQQVFDAKNGFLPNASILDILMNEGKNTLEILK